MGVYSREIFPRLCDWVMGDPRMARLRKDLLVDVGGEVLEIGFGTGLNLPHYPAHVRQITTVDPNPGMAARPAAGRRERHRRGPADAGRRGTAVRGGTFDCVVSTWTLCSIPDAGRALPRSTGCCGRAADCLPGARPEREAGVQRWQRRLNPIQRVLGDGCRLDLDVEAVVRGQPFRELRSSGS